MPCFDPRAAASDQAAHRIACYMLATLEAAGHPIPEFAREWWREHQDMDVAMRRQPDYDPTLAGIIELGRRRR